MFLFFESESTFGILRKLMKTLNKQAVGETTVCY